MEFSPDFGDYMGSGGDGSNHPQYDILKKHVERCIQDMFLEALRSQPPELLFVFQSEEQIDAFVKKILSYWEGLEIFEICQEVLELSKNFKAKWKLRGNIGPGDGSARIIDIFGANLK